ncbi:MAG TPA: flagellar protein FlgN [Accumulibacter sp.]|uniref:flagella synthesis protein FlgN n=1 Tax=Accumulibacter sp. TaxID=2053492 RepID=UPI0025DF7D49|nr:flagellar protein FlgN [Accumulibacter sp.]MCM8598735.1 flagellar protein FlgN [Accumulibacter sp.]MCM8662773.1 flagellar protein FlgN [Accumulibacter sp.]HNC50938.1 flagellar protein FlgN [Accumulibacter sp.]
MATTGNLTTSFLPTIAAEVADMQGFVALLEKEQEMLGKGRTDDLPALVEKKNELAAALASIADRRSQALVAAGLAADRAGMSALLAMQPDADGARGLWSSLLALATRARELNRVNGELIALRMQHNTQALQALLGTPLGLYGPDGQNTRVGSHRISDCA